MKDVVVRIPRSKGVNGGKENLERTARFVPENLRPARIEILPYHDLGKEKYERLALSARMSRFEPPDREDAERAENIVGSLGGGMIRYQ